MEGSVMASTRRGRDRRRRRVRRAAALGALAAVGMVLSARFAAQAVPPVASSCDVSAVDWGYEVELSPRTGSYTLAGAHFTQVPPGCAGASAVILYRDDEQVRYSSRVVLTPGLVDRLAPDVWAGSGLTGASWGIVAGT
jgi:hypothetical protein